MSEKKSFLVRSQILGLLVNTLTANYEYSRSIRENSPLPIQMQLSEKGKPCCQFFYCIFGTYIKFWTFWKKKKKEPHGLSISEVIDSKQRAYLNA